MTRELLITSGQRSSQRFSWHRCAPWRAGKHHPHTEDQQRWQTPTLTPAVLRFYWNCLILVGRVRLLGRDTGQGQSWHKGCLQQL